jgi:hypothetical protein
MEPRLRHRRTHDAPQLRSGRRPRQPHQDAQTPNVRPRQPRPTPHPSRQPQLTEPTALNHQKWARARFRPALTLLTGWATSHLDHHRGGRRNTRDTIDGNALRFAFYGRTSTEDHQDRMSSCWMGRRTATAAACTRHAHTARSTGTRSLTSIWPGAMYDLPRLLQS